MGGIFDAFCLRAFPTDTAIDEMAKRYQTTALSAAQVRQYLHDDPGRGWSYQTPLATYVITIEHPPVRACAVRRMTPDGMPTVKPYLAAINAYAAARGQGVAFVHQQTAKTPGGADILALMQAATSPGGVPLDEAFITITTNYHGRYRGDLQADVGEPGHVGVEIRFVHQLPTH